MRKQARKAPRTPKATIAPGSERNRIVGLTVLLVLVAAIFFGARLQEQRHLRKEAEKLPPAEAPIETVVATPSVDRAALAERIADETETDRVKLERDALAQALGDTATLLDAHFHAMGGRMLDEQALREITADRRAFRGELFRLRGSIRAVRLEPQPDGSDLWLGAITGEAGATVHFATRSVPEETVPGDWVRFDGLFLKTYRDEVEGVWVDGPLLAGPRMIRSYPDLGHVTELDEFAFLDVADADMSSGGDLRDYVPERFELLAFARDAADTVDWAAAPELDNALLTEIFESGRTWRARPVRVPVSKLLGLTNVSPGENPARLERVAQGWIGNFAWTGPSPVIQFQAPFGIEDVPELALIQARGFFLLNAKYQPMKGGLSVAPFFVLSSIEEFIPAPDHLVRNVVLGLCGVVLILAVLFWALLMRDARRARELREELVRRKRERRGQTSSPPA